MSYYDEYQLKHFGVKGMKWGVRRREKNLGISTTRKGHEGSASQDAKTANSLSRTAKTKGTAALSNKELKELVERMNLEQRYADLNVKVAPKSSMDRGQQHVKKVLDTANTAQQIYNVANSPMGKALMDQLKNAK